MPKRRTHAQSGVTSVINASACGVIERAREQTRWAKCTGMNGILGALQEELIDTSKETKQRFSCRRRQVAPSDLVVTN